MRNNAAPILRSSNHVLVPCEFRHTGRGCVRSRTAGVPLQGGGRQVPGRHASTRKRGLLPQAHHEAAAPSSGVHPPLQAWQGEASRCREADGQLLGAEGDHAGHESGRLRRPCCSKRTSDTRVLSTTGFEELRRYDDVRVPEPSHQARHSCKWRACWCRAIANF